MRTPRLPDPVQREAVRELLPSIPEQIELVDRTYREMARGSVELPPKIGIHTRPDSFIHAMPAYLRDTDVAVLKWVSGYPANPARGLPYITGVLVVNDAETGVPLAVMDAAEITAARTAAASGACIRAWAPHGWSRAAILGCGEQGRYHAAVLRTLAPTAEVRGYDPDRARAAGLVDGVVVAGSAREAVAGAEVVISAGPIVEHAKPEMRSAWLGERWLLLPIDFDFCVSPEVVGAADLFVTDDVEQYRYYRGLGYFERWPDPASSAGGALEQGLIGDRVVACNLGVGALDAAFAKVVLERAGSARIDA
jgi:ornithine cyclodeaminase/alanine dehydrogenase-like protein (mu-crystallin family)